MGRSSSSGPGSAWVSNPETLHASSGAQTDRLAADPRLARSHIGDSQRQALDHEEAGQTARRVFRRLSRGFYLNSWNDRNNGMAVFFGSVHAISDDMRPEGRPTKAWSSTMTNKPHTITMMTRSSMKRPSTTKSAT